MRGALAPIPSLVAALALAGCMGRTAPVAMAPQANLDAIAYGQAYAGPAPMPVAYAAPAPRIFVNPRRESDLVLVIMFTSTGSYATVGALSWAGIVSLKVLESSTTSKPLSAPIESW